MQSPLKAIVCGYEKSGTTLINEILRRHPDLDSGFECGFLLGDSPRDFPKIQPYFSFFKSTWELTSDDMNYICDTDQWEECYRRARERAPFIVNKNTWLFDKTPKYMQHLPDVLGKVQGIPCVVNVRDPRPLMLSWARWSGHKDDAEDWILQNMEAYSKRYLSYADGYTRAMERYKDRILLNQFEHLCEDPHTHLKKIFDFIGFEFSDIFLNFSSKHFVYGHTVSRQHIDAYQNILSSRICAEIVEQTKRYCQWHYCVSD